MTLSFRLAGIGAGLALLTAPGAAIAQDLQSAGSATRTKFFTDIYKLTVMDMDGNLESGDLNDRSKPIGVDLEVLYGGDVPDIPKGWSSELLPATTANEMTELRSAYRSLAKGDVVSMRYAPDTGTSIALNGKVLVTDESFALANAVLDIWFGPTPVSEDIKNAFL